MADNRKRLSELPSSTNTDGLYTLGVDAQNEGVKIPLGDIVNSVRKPATDAQTAAANAVKAANEAKAQASNAQSNANTAIERAGTAKSTAESAQQTAREAVNAANSAIDSAGAANETAQNALDTAQAALDATSSTSEGTKDLIAPRLFINAQMLLGLSGDSTLATVIGLLAAHKDAAMIKQQGVVITFLGESGWECWQFVWRLRAGQVRPPLDMDMFIRPTSWKKFGGSATVGNCYNVTVDEPKAQGYYTLEEAIAKTYEKGYTNIGIQITFSIADKSWKTYQYIGGDNSEENFKNPGNWLDLAGMTAGAETLINVDALCGPCVSATYYTLEYAIAAIVALKASTGIDYAKSGLVITYQTGEHSFETMQFQSTVGNFGEAALWKPFGNGGGSTIETKDEPSEGGKDAFSTGGAYTSIPADIQINTDTEGVVKMQLVNAGGEAVGNERQFAVGTGGGGQTGLILEITPKESPLYGQANGTLIAECAITLKNGADFESGIVEKVELYDRDTNQLLETYRLNKATSADKETFDFAFDVSRYFTLASQRKFRFIAYDDSDRTASRNINVTAVDLTIKSEQTLNYTASTAIPVGSQSAKTLPMYRFPNNASDKGILCTTEIFIAGQWKTLGTATVTDSFAHSITIDPKNCCGSVLTHGAYPLRIHGEDIASGVVGNYLHTAVMVVDSSNTTPIVVSRWYSEKQNGEVKQYESISIDFAAYSTANSQVSVDIVETIGNVQTVKRSTLASRNTTYNYSQRVQGHKTDGSVTIGLTAKIGSVASEKATFKVSGSLLNIESVSAQLILDMDMSTRSNADSDKTITDSGYTLTVTGSNYATNGFVKDTFGKEEYGTESDTGIMALRIAENVKGTLNYPMFNVSSIETNGAAIQFRVRTKHVADDSARLISCIGNGIGFYLTSKHVVFTTDNAATVAHTATGDLKDDTLTDIAIVIKPTSQAPYAGIGVVELYLDGELSGSCYYEQGAFSRHATPITFDGTHGDLYLYNIRAWETYYSFEQSFNNYLLKVTDSEAMIREYDMNNVMASQAAEGKPARSIPQMSALLDRGIPCLVMCKSKSTEDVPDNYPDYLEGLNGDKKTSRLLDWYFYIPQPWRNIIIEDLPTTNQGTTSSMRPIKNKKGKTKKARVRMMYDRDYILANYPEHIAEYDFLADLASKKLIQITPGSTPTNIFCIKVDYSESGGANNGASTNLYNDLSRALGSKYMTPAQNAYTGEYELNPCISSIPCALYRTDPNSPDATSPSYGYFHAKGNLNHDKGDAGVFGFEKVSGYNKDCLNYGDFTELIAERNQTLAQFAATLDKSAWNTEEIHVLSEFCGPNHKVFRYLNGAWTETTGTMTYSGGRWRIVGDVVNPVENYELRAYNALDWFQGVNTVDDMLTPDDKGKPIWLTYFESRYPDDDALNEAYEDGRKVPYTLFKWLEWCQKCNQNLTAADGNITIDGESVSGTRENRLRKFQRELHKVANVHSMIMYHVFTDYLAAVDQRAKNMMLGFYLDPDGVVRAYLNHLYDGDTILGSDNDCGLTIPAELDPNNDPNGYYQGHDSVLFTQLAKADYIWLSPYTGASDTNDQTKTVTVASVAAAMRTVQLANGLRPFSPQGIAKYWITDRLQKWPKLVSSYDGIRKYIENSVSNDNYFFALHGLSIQRLQDFVATRFRYRDGFYQCGDTFASAMQMRCTGTNMSVTITAAKPGFFGIGVDQANAARESVYLNAGESATLHTGNTNLGGGVMLYIFGADRIGELDIRNATPKQQGWDISQLTLLKKLIIGGANHTPATNTGEELATLNLGQLPFLEELDVRNFPILSIDATYCPRLKTLRASGSKMQSFTPAQTSPIDTLQLPGTMTSLTFVNLPNLSYPNGGLSIDGFSKVTRLQLAGCAKIDDFAMLQAVVNGGAALAEISVSNIEANADATILNKLKAAGTKGLGSDLDSGCDGISGTWILTKLIEDSELSALQSYFKHGDVGLTIHNAQFTGVVFDDTVNDPQNITNLDNGTTGETYQPSGHIVRIYNAMTPLVGKLDTATGKWVGKRMSRTNYHNLADETEFDYKDELGEGRDAMILCPDLWYKGVNDFKNQKKYIFWSSLENEPISTARNIRRARLADIVTNSNKAIQSANLTLGEGTLESEGAVVDMPNYNVYRLDVSGMKQVRWPGLNHSIVGAVFTNEDGIAVGTFNLAISNPMFDFVDGDYVFCDVPENAKYLHFTSKAANTELEAIAVDSSAIEAIEPDWVFNKAWLGGIYQASIDALMQMRSVSNAHINVGTNTHTTSNEWVYDEDGRVKNIPVGTLNYSNKDRQNIAMCRGAGFQVFDYEMSKLMAILWYSLNGTRDVQLKCGYGRGAGGTTGYMDNIGFADSVRTGSNNGCKCLGFESFYGCTWEVMDNVAVNVVSWKSYLKNRGVEIPADPLDAVWHIYDPLTKTERTVQGVKDSGYCIGRVKHGRHCDIIASKCTSDNSKWALNYCDGNYYSNSRCRVVGRSSSVAVAYGGIAYAVADYASSDASSSYAARLAFRGEIEITE